MTLYQSNNNLLTGEEKIMKRKIEIYDVLEILKSKAMIANEQEMEVILDIAYTIRKVCDDRGNKYQKEITQDCTRDLEFQKSWNIVN